MCAEQPCKQQLHFFLKQDTLWQKWQALETVQLRCAGLKRTSTLMQAVRAFQRNAPRNFQKLEFVLKREGQVWAYVCKQGVWKNSDFNMTK